MVATVLLMAFWIVAPNMPAGPVRERTDVLWSPAVKLGFDQNWSVFSPNPRDQSLEVVAVLEYPDGSTGEWTVPEFNALFGAYRGYRWGKWQERIRLDSEERLWESTAAWIAANNQVDGVAPSTVRLVRRWRDVAPLTASGFTPNPTNEFEYYVWTSQ